MAVATINSNARIAVEVIRSPDTTPTLVGEKATITLPSYFDETGCNRIMAYAKKAAYIGLDAKDSYGIVPIWRSTNVSKDPSKAEYKLIEFELIAFYLNKDEKNEAKRPQLVKVVDEIAEEIRKIVVKHRDAFHPSDYGYLLRYSEGGW